MFDLFKLYDKNDDVKSRGWIRLGGDALLEEVRKMLFEILNKGYNLSEISRIFSTKLGVSPITIDKQLREIKNKKWYGRRHYVSIPLLSKLILLWNFNSFEEKKWKLIKLAEWASNGTPRAKPTKLIKELTPELAMISGAHAADGTLAMAKTGKNSNMYRWVVTDGNIYSLLELQKWVKSSFGLAVKIKKSAYDNCFLFVVDSKVVLRYLNKFFDFKVGNKTNTVTIPEVIRESSFKFKRNFALGVLTFDGSVDLDGNLRLNVKSKKLLKSVANVMQKDGLKITFPKNTKKRGWVLKCKIIENKKHILHYFAKNSINWKKAYGFLYGFEKEEILQLFKKTPISKITLNKFLETRNRLNTTDKKILAKNLDVTIRTIRKYTNLYELIKF
jgi:hypothetical protein